MCSKNTWTPQSVQVFWWKKALKKALYMIQKHPLRGVLQKLVLCKELFCVVAVLHFCWRPASLQKIEFLHGYFSRFLTPSVEQLFCGTPLYSCFWWLALRKVLKILGWNWTMKISVVLSNPKNGVETRCITRHSKRCSASPLLTVSSCTFKKCFTAPSKDVQNNVTEQPKWYWETSAWRNTFKRCQSFETLTVVPLYTNSATGHQNRCCGQKGWS